MSIEGLGVDAKRVAITHTMHQLTRLYGESAIGFGYASCHIVEAVPTGLNGLDAALGIGGLPRGRIVEIYGQPGVGKTALALHLARQVPTALYIDADHGITPAQGAGLYSFHVDTLEDALTACEMAAAAFDLIVIDTLSALPTRGDLKAKMGDFSRHLSEPTAAEILSRSFPWLSHTLSRHRCTLVLVTQIRENPKILYGNPEFSLGGRALKHYASIRLKVRFVEKIKQAETVIGQKIRICVRKNKCGPQYQEVPMAIWFNAPERDCLKDLSAAKEGSCVYGKYADHRSAAARQGKPRDSA